MSRQQHTKQFCPVIFFNTYQFLLEIYEEPERGQKTVVHCSLAHPEKKESVLSIQHIQSYSYFFVLQDKQKGPSIESPLAATN